MAGICTANDSPNNCGHRHLTVDLDGESLSLHVHNSTLDEMPWGADEKAQFLLLAAKRARVRGLSMVDALNRVLIGAEATNVKQYAIVTKDITKTNIGTSYVNVPVGLNGERSLVEFTGCTQYRLILHANLVGTGPFGFRLVRDGDSAVLYENANIAQTGERELDTDWQTLPAAASGLTLVRLQAKSTVAADDPVIRRCILLVR